MEDVEPLLSGGMGAGTDSYRAGLRMYARNADAGYGAWPLDELSASWGSEHPGWIRESRKRRTVAAAVEAMLKRPQSFGGRDERALVDGDGDGGAVDAMPCTGGERQLGVQRPSSLARSWLGGRPEGKGPIAALAANP